MKDDNTEVTKPVHALFNQVEEGFMPTIAEDGFMERLANFFSNAFQRIDLNISQDSCTEQTLVKSNNLAINHHLLDGLCANYDLMSNDNVEHWGNNLQKLKVRLPMIYPAMATTHVKLTINLDPSVKYLPPNSLMSPLSKEDVLFNPHKFTRQIQMEIYDANGERHRLNARFRHVALDTWENYLAVNDQIITPIIDNDANAKPLMLDFSSVGAYADTFKIKFKPNNNLPYQEINVDFDFTQYTHDFTKLSLSANGHGKGKFLSIKGTEDDQCFAAIYDNNIQLDLGTFQHFLFPIGLSSIAIHKSPPMLAFAKVLNELKSTKKQEFIPEENLNKEAKNNIEETFKKQTSWW